MKSVVMVIAQSMFRDEEYAEPKEILEATGAHVTTASEHPGRASGRFGLVAEASISVADAQRTSWDAVVFVGGAGAKAFFDDPDAHELARRVHDEGGVVAAICIAPSTLAHAGLLNGVRATAYPTQEDDLRAHGAVWTGEPVTVDGRIITGNGPESATAFGRAIAAAFGLLTEK